LHIAMAARKKVVAAAAEDPKVPATPATDVGQPGPDPAIPVAAPAAPAAPEPSKKAKATDPITVKFRDHVGEPQERVFSKEVHGDNFAAVADEFKATNANKLISE
jgi:hypothetical protein